MSTGSKLKKAAPTTKKPTSAATLTTPKKASKKADAAVGSPNASSASKASAESSHAADHHDLEEASVPASSASSVSNHPDEAAEATASEPVVATDTNEAETDPVLDSTNNENDSSNNGGVDQELINQSEIGSDVIVSSQDVTEDEKKVTEKQDDIIVDLPKQETDNEQEVESVDIGSKEQDKVLIVEPSANQASDAEVAAITGTHTTTTTPAVAITSNKPQMASLRSRFENLNNNTTNNTLNHNQLQTTSSKEIRSKSPNRISDMINRFQ